MTKAIYLSIKPEHTKRIVTGEKNYEFRNYYPKQQVDTLYVYETYPTCELKYIMKIGNVIEYPNKIAKTGYGNDEFNQGLKNTKYAYEIKSVSLLENPIDLTTLKSVYGFTPPQAYAYDSRYATLTEYLHQSKISRIV